MMVLSSVAEPEPPGAATFRAAVKGGNQGFVVREEEEKTTFKIGPEVENS